MATTNRGLLVMAVVMVAVMGSACNMKVAMATNYVVGDSAHWTIMSYDSWLSGKTFKVGDTLEFIYTSAHDVVEVSEADYNACSAGSNSPFTDGDHTFNLTAVGSTYYICSVPSHCPNGMKLAVTVVAASATAPTSSSTPSTPTTPTTPATPTTPSTPSSPSSSPLSLPSSIFTVLVIIGLSILFF